MDGDGFLFQDGIFFCYKNREGSRLAVFPSPFSASDLLANGVLFGAAGHTCLSQGRGRTMTRGSNEALILKGEGKQIWGGF